MACNRWLRSQKLTWANHTLKLLQVMLAAQQPTPPESTTTHAANSTCTKDAPSATSSTAAADSTSQSSAEQDIPSPPHPSSAPASGSLPTPPVKADAAGGSQTDSGRPSDKSTAPTPSAGPIAMARLQRLAASVKSVGAEHFRATAALCDARSKADNFLYLPEEGQHDCEWAPQYASMHLTLQMPHPRVVEAAGDLLRGVELNADRVKQFFLQVCSLCSVPCLTLFWWGGWRLVFKSNTCHHPFGFSWLLLSTELLLAAMMTPSAVLFIVWACVWPGRSETSTSLQDCI